MFKICSFNVNSINSRLDHLVSLLKEQDIDVIMLQELKCSLDKFPAQIIEDLGYNFAISGQKSYNGVAILSKRAIENVEIDFIGNPNSEQARFISVDSYLGNEMVKFINLYIPNGGELESDKFAYKLSFLDALYNFLRDLDLEEMPIFMAGDFNVALTQMDVYDHNGLNGSVCYHPEERARMRKILSLGFFDLFRSFNPHESSFSWWDYRGGGFQHNKGMRIDYILANSRGASFCKEIWHDVDTRAKEKASDHAPVIALLDS
jgi:exodeoxyribonuclease-3